MSYKAVHDTTKNPFLKGLRTKASQQGSGYGMGLNSSEQTGYNNLDAMEVDPTQQIFGHNIFDNEYLTFEPNINVATPSNYRLGAGDEVHRRLGSFPEYDS